MSLETDEEGLLVTRPVLGWTTAPVAGTAVILQIQYSEKPADIDTGGHSLQVVLTPPQCLEIAETLTKLAKRVLGQRVPDQKN